MPELKWIYDPEFQTWELRIGSAQVSLIPRQPYCDRGHWQGMCEGIPYIDEADAFPRYYMNLERAKLEMQEWLEWRLQCERD